jgi:hypothetical protein
MSKSAIVVLLAMSVLLIGCTSTVPGKSERVITSVTEPVVMTYTCGGASGTAWIHSTHFSLGPSDDGTGDVPPRIVLFNGWLVFQGVAPNVSTEATEAAGGDTMFGTKAQLYAEGKSSARPVDYKKHRALVGIANGKSIFYLKETASQLQLRGTGNFFDKWRELKKDMTFTWQRGTFSGDWCKAETPPPSDIDESHRAEIEDFLQKVGKETHCPPTD